MPYPFRRALHTWHNQLLIIKPEPCHTRIILYVYVRTSYAFVATKSSILWTITFSLLLLFLSPSYRKYTYYVGIYISCQKDGFNRIPFILPTNTLWKISNLKVFHHLKKKEFVRVYGRRNLKVLIIKIFDGSCVYGEEKCKIASEWTRWNAETD